MTQYQISLLGQPRFAGPDGPVRHGGLRARALLYYLAAQPHHAFSRSQLAGLLWPDDREADGRNRLNTTLSRLRQLLPVWPLRAEGDTLQWNPAAGVLLDTARFLELSRSGETDSLAAAAGLWRGPLLDGFDLPDNPVYDDWLRSERLLWERQILDVLAKLVRAEEAAADWAAMANHCRQALALDPLQERFHRWLMVAYFQSGDRAAALAQYSTCCQLMRSELAADPDPVTTALRDQIAAGQLARTPPTAERPRPGSVSPLSAPASAYSPRDLAIMAASSGHDPAVVAADPRLQEMGWLAMTDALTGLYNRRYIATFLKMEIEAGGTGVVALLDLDRFKEINDKYGHNQGDEVLRTCARMLREELPEAVAGRLGGDEFALVFPGQDVNVVAVLVETVLRHIQATIDLPDQDQMVQCSAGIAGYPRDGTDPSTLLRAADAALYWAKRSQGRRVRLARDLGEVATLGDPRSLVWGAGLTGRDSLWARLMEQMERVAAGRGRVIGLEGPAGSGKTRLMAELAGAAARAGWQVVQVAPDPSAGPYQPFRAALAQLRGAPLRPARGDANAPAPAVPLDQVFAELLEVARAGPPLCICVDDLHEAENFLAAGLVRFGITLEQYPILLVLTVRTDADFDFAWEELRTLGVARGNLSLEYVAGLDLSGTHKLVTALLGGILAPSGVRIIHDLTGGNPLHITHVLQAWLSTGVLTPGLAGWTLDFAAAVRAPRDLRQSLIWRVRQLQPEVQEMLGLAAVLGRQFPSDVLQALSGAGPDELEGWLDRALREQMLVPVGLKIWRFAHPLLQEAAYAGLSPQTRRLAHGMAGHLLLEFGTAPPAELARHFDAAGMTSRAFQYHVKAGEEAAARFSHSVARYHFERARRLLPAAGVSFDHWVSQLALKLSQAARSGGDPTAAAAACQDALRHRSSLDRAETLNLLLELAESSLAAGSTEEAEEAYAEAARLAGPGVPERERLRVRALGMRLAHHRPGTTDKHLNEALALAEQALRAGETYLAGRLYAEAAGIVQFLHRPTAEVAEMNRRAVPLLPVGSGPEAVRVRLLATLHAESIDQANYWFQQALDAAVAIRETPQLLVLLRLFGLMRGALGHWEVARRYLEVTLQLAGRRGYEVERDRCMAALGLHLAWMGEYDEGATLATAAADAALQRRDWQTAVAARVHLARCLTAAGRPRETLKALQGVEQWLHARHPTMLEVRLARVEALLELDDPAGAQAEMVEAEGVDQAGLAPALATRLALLRGRLARQLGQAAEALKWLRWAQSQSQYPFVERYALAWGRYEEGLILHEQGQTEAAAQCLAEARATFVKMKAAPALAELERRWAARR